MREIPTTLATPAAATAALRGAKAFWLVDDDSHTKRRLARSRRNSSATITISLHHVNGTAATMLKACKYRPGTPGGLGRIDMVLELLRTAGRGAIVAGTSCTSRELVSELIRNHRAFVLEIRPSAKLVVGDTATTPSTLVANAIWKAEVGISAPFAGDPQINRIAMLGPARFGNSPVYLYAVGPASPVGTYRTRYCIAPSPSLAPHETATALGWLRWIKTVNRRTLRAAAPPHQNGHKVGSDPPHMGRNYRPNIALAGRMDLKALASLASFVPAAGSPVGAKTNRKLKVMELFAGAGLLGLGFLESVKSRGYRIVFSGEIDPVSAATLTSNHQRIVELARLSATAIPRIRATDLQDSSALRAAMSADHPDVVIGGPPCQGFSNANRNSWSSSNPNNRLIGVFLRYVRSLEPRAVLLENVQGILWTPKGTSAENSAAQYVINGLRRAGYEVYARLLDAVWYGVPQHRTRFFLIGLHKSLGYRADDFGSWGPFPVPTHGPGLKPYVTVRAAIADLPTIGNGHLIEEMPYEAPADLERNEFLSRMREHAPLGFITDHMTTRHAPYVLDRYKKIPQGGNWQDIASMLTNYGSINRTHSNIYRRLSWDQPAVTIGHYRKSMIVHPDQDRGLSLREASRLQSIPDWFRFSGSPNATRGGLMHKQQQIANAVSPNVARALAEHLVQLL